MKLYQAYEDQDKYYLLMELCEQDSFRYFFDNGVFKEKPEEEIIEIQFQIL